MGKRRSRRNAKENRHSTKEKGLTCVLLFLTSSFERNVVGVKEWSIGSKENKFLGVLTILRRPLSVRTNGTGGGTEGNYGGWVKKDSTKTETKELTVIKVDYSTLSLLSLKNLLK